MAESNYAFDDVIVAEQIEALGDEKVAQIEVQARVDFDPYAIQEGTFAQITVTRRYRVTGDVARDILKKAM